MTRATTFAIAAIALLCTAATRPPVTFDSPYSCHDNHGKAGGRQKMMRRLHKIRANFDKKR